MLRHPTLELFHELRLSGMAQAFEEQTAMPDIAELSFGDRLSLLLEREKTEREQRRYVRLKGLAKLHLDATIEDLNFKAPRGLDRSFILCLASGQWIRDGQTVLVSGAPGSGKSYLACARPSGLPPRHLHSRLPRLPPPRRTRPRPGRRVVSKAHPAARQNVAPHPRRPLRPPRHAARQPGPRRPLARRRR